MSWIDRLFQASWNGVPFGVTQGRTRVGRRNAIHEYPYRDTVWVEDLGRAARRIELIGFLVENSLVYGGGDVIQQRERMIAAAEQKGEGILVHPTLGRLQVSLIDLDIEERRGDGLVFVLRFLFIEAGKRVFPAASVSTGDIVNARATTADAACASAFGTAAVPPLAYGAPVVAAIGAVTSGWTAIANIQAGSATSLLRLTALLPVSDASQKWGRYNGGALSSLFASTPPLPETGATIASLEAQGAANRAAVASAAAGAATAAAALSSSDTADYTAAMQAVPAALLASATDPAEALPMLAALATLSPSLQGGTSPIPMAIATAQGSTGDLARRAAVVALARASALYQPSSYDDAAAVRAFVCGFLAAEELIAGDQGEDDAFAALRALDVAVSEDLTTRGADLSPIATFTLSAPLPALLLANRLYLDSSRGDELVGQIDPIHPAFMPPSFQALAR